jgi:SAM-dependent methyltransferase
MSAPIRRTALAFLLAVFCGAAFAQAQRAPASPAYEPQSGQEGKDVVWIPTPQVVVDKMLDMAKVTPRDFVMDLGSGDGRTVITAAKRGARAMGVEYNPDMVEYARRNAEKAGVGDKASFVKADLFETDFSKATVITMFLLPDINLKLRPKILDLKPGTRIVSNSFSMGDWKEDDRVDLSRDAGCNVSWCTALFWVVPAKVWTQGISCTIFLRRALVARNGPFDEGLGLGSDTR